MELARLHGCFQGESDGYVSVAESSAVSMKSRMISTSSLVEERRTSPSRHKIKESIPWWSKLERLTSTWEHWISRFGWRTGIEVAFSISILVLVINLVLLLVGAVRKPGYKAGIGILHSGTSDQISRLSTAYHILINILSTGLLTSSSYCMQLLCAPRRDDIDAAHARGNYVDIGILNFRNLRFISRRRSFFVLILTVTSVPLHLLYNSAIFEVTAGQNYVIRIVDSRNTALIHELSSTMKQLQNSEWQILYDTQYIPNSGDLYLVLDAISFDVSVNLSNSTWELTFPDNSTDYIWQALPYSTDQQNMSIPMTLGVTLNETTGTFEVAQQQPLQRVVVPLTEYSPTSMPAFELPTNVTIDVSSSTWKDRLALNPDSWMFPPFHIDYAFSEPLPNSSSVHISLAFMVVVVTCNAAKTIVIYRTLKEPLYLQILTFGDAVSSFLEQPDATTHGLCTLEKKDIIDRVRNPAHDDTEPWQYHRRFVENSTRERWASNIFIWSAAVIAFFVMVAAILLASPIRMAPIMTDGAPWDWNWATSSTKQLPIAQSSFSTGGILFNAWLANAPQLVLSMAYFALNRMCTSICFTIEWNKYATYRKGLRTIDPLGEQRPAHFLQLPYRWAVSLTTISGMLHWLLSQSLFLVLLEIRDSQGAIIETESKSTVGYSNLSLLVFATIYFATLFIVLGFQMRRITLRLPPANHCSLIISAACHPPPEDTDAHLKKVQWGVVRARFGGEVGHCSFTSEEVSNPEEGKHYA